MPARGAELYLVALVSLRERLTSGRYPPESRFSAIELAAEFGLSPTPLREVLSHLSGEGLLVDRRGQGFFVPRLAAGEIVDLYRLSYAHLEVALAAVGGCHPRQGFGRPPTFKTAYQAVIASERIFGAWVAAAAGRSLLQGFSSVQAQLGRVRRIEPHFIEDLVSELRDLLTSGLPGSATAMAGIRSFHERRIGLAPRLAERLERGPWPA